MANEQYTQLIKTLEGIRDERGMHANTATRIGSALIELANFVLANGDNFLSKVSDDTAEGFITFLKGLKTASIIVDKITAENLVAEDIKTETLTVDKGEDEPQDGGKTYVQSSGYVRGGKGFGIYKDANGAWGMDIENINVRGALSVNELRVDQTKYMGGEVLLTVGGSIKATEVETTGDGWKVFFETTDDKGREIHCQMEAKDLAKCQTWNEKEGQHFYWLEVTEVGDDYITLRRLAGDSTPYSEPRVGDEIIHLGNTENKERQAALIFSAGDQSIRIWTGINTTSLSSANAPIDLNPIKSHILAQYIKFASGDSLDKAMDDVNKGMDALTSKAEKEFVIWFGDYVPTLENRPYTDWIADGKDERELHLQDIFYIHSSVESGGRAFRFEQDKDDTFSWNEDTDKDTLLALERAAQAQAAANEAKASLEIMNNKIEALVEGGYLNEDGTLKQSVTGLVLKENFSEMFTKEIYDGIAKSASITTAIENGISKANIKADQITLEGHTVINDYFTIDEDGNATVGATDAERTLTVNGTINATKGTFEYCTIGKGCSIFSEEGWNLKGDATGAAWILSGISTKEIELVLNYDGTKTNKLLLRNAPSNGNSMIEIVTYHSNGISVITDNRGIVVEGNSSSAVPLDVTGNVNLRATRSNEHVFVQGLTLNVRTVSVNGTIVNTDDIIVFSNTSDITVMLPPASGNTGKIFYMKKKGSGGVTVISSFGDIMAASGTSVSESNGDVNSGRSMIFISDGTYWISYFCG